MTLSEAIKHCEERIDCSECGKEHKQLAEWLTELKRYKELEEQGGFNEMEKTNFDVYKKELDRITKAGYEVAVKNNKPVKCSYIACEDCDLSNPNCQAELIQWLLLPKCDYVLSEDEKELCKLVGGGWIARDANGCLWWYEFKPRKYSSVWMSVGTDPQIRAIFSRCRFEFIKWEDEEPWEVKVSD